MIRRFLVPSVLLNIMFFFLFNSSALATRVQVTLGWHNLIDNDYYFAVSGEGQRLFNDDEKSKKGWLRGSRLTGLSDVETWDIDTIDGDFSIWSLDTRNANKFNKWINKKTRKALKKAAKKQQKALNGSKKGWKPVFREWRDDWRAEDDNASLWAMYNETIGEFEEENEFYNPFIEAAFNQLDGKVFKGWMGDVKFAATLDIFENPTIYYSHERSTLVPESATLDIFENPTIYDSLERSNPVPEPATMVLFGLGLLGLAAVSRRKP